MTNGNGSCKHFLQVQQLEIVLIQFGEMFYCLIKNQEKRKTGKIQCQRLCNNEKGQHKKKQFQKYFLGMALSCFILPISPVRVVLNTKKKKICTKFYYAKESSLNVSKTISLLNINKRTLKYFLSSNGYII